ncbi:RNA polymerase sigma factor [Dokdonella ginsengisoli]|uniref:RNA polymerase sigma factor n=1 Tax=Dokdonella ginsengisoli TaxID=363846 RepID=UPI0036D2B7B7
MIPYCECGAAKVEGVLTGKTRNPLREHCQQLLQEHRGIVLKVANLYGRGVEDRRDLAQEICAQAWKAFASWDAARPFPTWLYRVALNVAISHARAGGVRTVVAFDELDVEPSTDGEAQRENDDGVRRLYRCIERLGPLDRALMLLYLDERSQREIAEVLGLSETNVATKIGRLKIRIRQQFGA